MPTTEITANIRRCHVREGCNLEDDTLLEDFKNDQMCGAFTINLYKIIKIEENESLETYPDFITFSKEEDAETWTISLNPIVNEDLGTYNMKLVEGLEDYPDYIPNNYNN